MRPAIVFQTGFGAGGGVGDIQPGERRMLRFNTGSFIREHAPELSGDQALAASRRFRFERM